MPWIKLDDGFWCHEKVLDILSSESGGAAVGLHVRALSYCGGKLTDGHLSESALRMLDAAREHIELLVEHGLWDANGAGYMVHDYLQYNPSREQVQKEREAAKERMRKARERRSHERSSDSSHARSGESSPEQPAERSPVRSATPTRPVPTHTQEKKKDMSQADAGDAITTDEIVEVEVPTRPEVVALCDLLADAIAADGSKRPTPSAEWHTECRRLIDIDGATPEEIEAVIAWVHKPGEFWANNILSMKKLRNKWVSLTKEMRRKAGSSSGTSGFEENMQEFERLKEEGW